MRTAVVARMLAKCYGPGATQQSGIGQRFTPTNPPRTCQVQKTCLLLLLRSLLLGGLLLRSLLLRHSESPPRGFVCAARSLFLAATLAAAACSAAEAAQSRAARASRVASRV